jgi:hypothetical protein
MGRIKRPSIPFIRAALRLVSATRSLAPLRPGVISTCARTCARNAEAYSGDCPSRSRSISRSASSAERNAQRIQSAPARRTWRKLNLAIDEHHQVLACELTTPEVGDPSAHPDRHPFAATSLDAGAGPINHSNAFTKRLHIWHPCASDFFAYCRCLWPDQYDNPRNNSAEMAVLPSLAYFLG